MLDTDILVDALRRFSAGLDYVENAEQEGALRISIITEMELIIGCRNRRELRRLEDFLRRVTILGMTASIAERAVALLHEYQLSHGLRMVDSLIATTALTHDETLYTKNVRHFRMLPGLRVARPY